LLTIFLIVHGLRVIMWVLHTFRTGCIRNNCIIYSYGKDLVTGCFIITG